MVKQRFDYLDVLKALAIIAVVLYHIGYTKYGYLGVDIFLVVNGFLLANSLSRIDTFLKGYAFFVKRILRLLPLVIIASVVCLLWGSFWMLPYAYQDLSQNVIATNVFANNILMSIKASNYWNVLNDYKPLMHTWYLGIIVQFYVFFPLILILCKKIYRGKKDITLFVVGIFFFLSLVLYLLPNFSTTAKFYYLPFRLFEFCAGCGVALWFRKHELQFSSNKLLMSFLSVAIYVAFGGILFINNDYIDNNYRLLLTVALTCGILYTIPHIGGPVNNILSNKWLALVGKASFSIYIWHQIVFAFCRYSFTSDIDVKTFMILIIIVGILSVISYIFIEQKISNYLKKEKGERNVLFACVCSVVVLLGASFYLNSCSGVIRDIPELDTYIGKTSERMHIVYNESAYQLDKDFKTKDKLHWVVVGDSYGRDFVNILREANICDKVEISYVLFSEYEKKEKTRRIQSADLVFRTHSIYPNEESIERFYRYARDNKIDTSKIVVVGSKRFGQCLGQIYRYRNDSDYFKHTVEIEDVYFFENKKSIQKYGVNYVDLIAPISINNNKVRVFTEDNKIISQDCEHLTQNGAKMYANSLKPLIEDYIYKCIENRKLNE